MMSLLVWLPGPMFLLGGGVSVPVPMFLQGWGSSVKGAPSMHALPLGSISFFFIQFSGKIGQVID